MEILNTIRTLDNLSYNESQIRAYILQHPEKIQNMTISELAKACFTSNATVTRFCKKVGVSRFTQFKIELAAELSQKSVSSFEVDKPYRNESSSDSEEDQARKALDQLDQASLIAISETSKLVDLNTYNQVVDLIDSSVGLDIYGSGTSNIVASDAAFKFMRIGKLVCFFNLVERQHIQSLIAQPDHLAIIFSYSGENKDMLEIANVLKERHVTTVAITANNGNSLSRIADYVLPVYFSEPLMRKVSMSSRLAQMHAVDILFTLCFNKNRDKYIKETENTYFL